MLWVGWVIAAVILAAGEMLTTGFYLAPFAGGAAIAAILAAVGLGVPATLAAFIVASVALLTTVRPVARRHLRMPPQLRTGTAALVGRDAVVLERIANDDASGCARIEGGQVWTARALYDDRIIEPGERVQVVEIRGATALVD
jgi:membrane protein implicated in regulation of membrane protease activity